MHNLYRGYCQGTIYNCRMVSNGQRHQIITYITSSSVQSIQRTYKENYIDSDEDGMKTGGRNISYLRYAVDIILLRKDSKEMTADEGAIKNTAQHQEDKSNGY